MKLPLKIDLSRPAAQLEITVAQRGGRRMRSTGRGHVTATSDVPPVHRNGQGTVDCCAEGPRPHVSAYVRTKAFLQTSSLSHGAVNGDLMSYVVGPA